MTGTVDESMDKSLQKHACVTVKLSEVEAKQLKEKPDIVTVEKDSMVEASNVREKVKVKKGKISKRGKEWNYQAIKVPKADRLKKDEKKIKVAVIDSGINALNDIELAGTYNLVPGYEDFSPLLIDVSGHGDAVAGVVAALDNDTGITGINPNVDLYSIRVLDENNKAPISRVIAGIYKAIEEEVDIINMSFGTATESEALRTAIEDAKRAGILLVAAAGNKGVMEYPAAYEGVMAVGAVDEKGNKSEGSATGEELDVVAPGELICSTAALGGCIESDGTSMSAAHVTAVASLLWQKDKSMSADFILQLLKASANGYGESQNYGSGLIDYKYANEIYDSFKKNYRSKSEEVYENKSSLVTFEESEIKASWAAHNKKMGAAGGTASMQAGAIYPDQKASGLTLLGTNPAWHGHKNVNNFASYKYMIKVADAVFAKGNNAKVSDVKAAIKSVAMVAGMETHTLDEFKAIV